MPTRHGWPLMRASTPANSHDPRYRANPVDRCYFCKTNLYARIRVVTDGGDRVGHQPGRSRRLPARPDAPRPSTASCTRSSRPGIDKADVCAHCARVSAWTTSPSCRRSPACRAGSKPASPSTPPTSPSSTRSRRSSRHVLGAQPIIRCRVTHAGVVVELGDARSRRCRRARRDRCGARARRAGRRLHGVAPAIARGAAFLRDRRRCRLRDRLGARSRAPASPRPSSASRSRPRRSRRSWRCRVTLGRAAAAHAAAPAQHAALPRRSAQAARLRRALAHGDPRRHCRRARPSARRDRRGRHVRPARRARGRAHARVPGRGRADDRGCRRRRAVAADGRIDEIRAHRVVIAVGGHGGRAFSVLAGLSARRSIAVPTSVGYGVAAGGARRCTPRSRAARRASWRQHRQRLRRRARGAAHPRRAGGVARRRRRQPVGACSRRSSTSIESGPSALRSRCWRSVCASSARGSDA